MLRSAISDLLQDPRDVVLARSIFGTADADAIASRVEGYVRARLARTVVACPRFIQSVGAVFVLDLDDGSRVVLKAHAFDGKRLRGFTRSGEIAAVYDAHAHYAEAGFPCSRVLVAPAPWEGGAIAAMTFVDGSRAEDPHEPKVRSAMAEELARSMTLGRTLSATKKLPRDRLPPDALFPEPHNAIFDFGAPGGEWIDARARQAREVLERWAKRPIVMHTDFSGANVRVSNGSVIAVYDMDSVACIDEMRCLASAAVHFTYTGEGAWSWPTREEARAFVDAYVRARGRALDAHEKARLDAAAIYAIAYTARCEHGLGKPAPTMADVLRAAPDTYFG
jgi:hypothetical protein